MSSFYCQCRDREIQINSSRYILCTIRRKISHDILKYLMNTLNISSGAYTAIFHSSSAYDAQSGRLWHLSV